MAIAARTGVGWQAACAAALLLLASDCLAERRWHASLGATTEEVWRGVSHAPGVAAARGSLSVSTPGGWYAGAWTSVAMRKMRSEPRLAPEVELDLFAGHRRPLGDAWMLDLGLVRYTYPRDARTLDYDHTELIVKLDYAGRISATLAVSPDTTLYTTRGYAIERTAIAWELAFVQPIAGRLSVTGGIGYLDLEDHFSTGYAYWNAGLAWEAAGFGIDLAHIRTDGRGRELFEAAADPRTVLSLIVAF